METILDVVRVPSKGPYYGESYYRLLRNTRPNKHPLGPGMRSVARACWAPSAKVALAKLSEGVI